MNNSSENTKHPSHAIYQVIGEGDKSRWVRVGTAWTNRDGKGFNLKFDAYPVVGRTMLREFREQDETGMNGGQK
jgi:hypothetical protein